jgi:hypothetical protein
MIDLGTARALLDFYASRGTERGLPWREPDCPPELRVLVEGLCVRTRAEAVARRWPEIEGADGWLDLPIDERLRRAGLLGLGRFKRILVDHLAELVKVNRSRDATVTTLGLAGEEAYCVGVYRLLLGLAAGPADSHVERISARYGCLPGDLVWGATRRAVAIALEGPEPTVGSLAWGHPPPTYRAFAALLDVGVFVCHARRPPKCDACPLVESCRKATDAEARREVHERYRRSEYR